MHLFSSLLDFGEKSNFESSHSRGKNRAIRKENQNYEFISNIHENSELKDAKRKHINCFKKRRLFSIFAKVEKIKRVFITQIFLIR